MAAFRVAIITDEFTQDFELLCRTAVELGVTSLEVRTIGDKNIVDMSDSEIEEVGRLARAANLTVCSIASPVFKCTLPGGGEIDSRFEQDAFRSAHTYDDQPRILGRALDIAESLGADIVRVFSFWRTVEPIGVRQNVVESLGEAAEKAASRNLRIGLENEHACNVATGAETAAAVSSVEHPNLGVVWDPANAYVSGENPFPEGYGRLPAGRVLHVHAKDGVLPPGADRMQWGELGAGEVDWKGQLKKLTEDGYRGMVSVETHWGGPDGNKFEGSKICTRNLQPLIREA